MINMHQIETVVSLRKTQANDMLKTLSLMSSEEADNCKEREDAATQAIKAYYQQPGASKYNYLKRSIPYSQFLRLKENPLRVTFSNSITDKPILVFYLERLSP